MPVLLADGYLAYLTTVQLHQGETPAESRWEFHAHAYGPAGPVLADRLTECAQEWDRHVRETGYPAMTVHPAGTPDHELPTGHVLDKKSSRLVFQWPGSPADARPEALTAAGSGHDLDENRKCLNAVDQAGRSPGQLFLGHGESEVWETGQDRTEGDFGFGAG